ERAHLRRDHHRTPDGRAAERHAHHRNNFFVAGYRPPADQRDRGARLSGGRGMRTHVRDDLRHREHGDRFRLCDRGPASENLMIVRVRNPSLAIGVTIVAAIAVAAILGPMLLRADPLSIDLASTPAGPSRGRWRGLLRHAVSGDLWRFLRVYWLLAVGG